MTDAKDQGSCMWVVKRPCMCGGRKFYLANAEHDLVFCDQCGLAYHVGHMAKNPPVRWEFVPNLEKQQ